MSTESTTEESKWDIKIGRTSKESHVRFNGKDVPRVVPIKAEINAGGMSKVTLVMYNTEVEIDPESVTSERENKWI